MKKKNLNSYKKKNYFKNTLKPFCLEKLKKKKIN